MKKYLILIATVTLFLFQIKINGQEQSICTSILTQSSTKTQIGGLYKPAKNGINEYLKALVVFVQFDGTTEDINNSAWKKDEMPNWANNIIAPNKSNNYPEFSLSDYWSKMSVGSFDFIGDVYPNLVIINTEDYYKTNGYTFGKCNEDALRQIDPNVDFSNYDKWSYNSTTKTFEFQPDGYVDMIIMIYRTPDNANGWFDDGHKDFSAIAVLAGWNNNFTLNLDGVKILGKRSLEVHGSGITIKKGLKGNIPLIPIISHEYGHYLFGSDHNDKEGLMYENTKYVMTAWEREHLGYLTYKTCNQNNFTAILGDYVETGDVLKIPIPITNPNSSTYFLVENHRKICNYDQIIRGGSINGGYSFNSSLGSGVYVWLIRNGGNNSTHTLVNYEALTADGRWDWVYDGDYYAGPGWYVGETYEGYLPKTKRVATNRNTGKCDREPKHIYWNGHMASKWVDDQPSGSYQLTLNVKGDEYDAFNFGYNELITPWSNPSSYVNGNTNISIQLYNENGNNVTIKVFNTENSGKNLPPSKPQNLRIAWYNNHPKLTWDKNEEPDMQSYNIHGLTQK